MKNRADIWRTGKKMYKQKGTGGARHGSARVPQFRGGGRAFGPLVRSHAHDLPKKVRALALRHALSAKAKDGGIVVWANAEIAEPKTKALQQQFAKLGLNSALIIDGAAPQENFCRRRAQYSSRSMCCRCRASMFTTFLRREKLVLTRAAIDALEARFK